MMNGRIGVQSTPGKGSIFRVDLRVDLVDETTLSETLQTQEAKEVRGLAPGQPEYRILIVEDQHENQLLLSRLMESVGLLQVKIAENGEQGVELFKSWRPHFIWMDQRMPAMDGLEATRRIRKLPGGSDVKIVAVTASAFREQEQELREVGIDDYVRKPFRLEKIYHCLEQQLGLKWEYAKADNEQQALLVAPPREVLDELEQMADEGRIFEIQELAARLEAENEAYIPFAQELQKLAKGFDIERIATFTREFLE
jgi:CheY-like chemotaxis protein